MEKKIPLAGDELFDFLQNGLLDKLLPQKTPTPISERFNSNRVDESGNKMYGIKPEEQSNLKPNDINSVMQLFNNPTEKPNQSVNNMTAGESTPQQEIGGHRNAAADKYMIGDIVGNDVSPSPKLDKEIQKAYELPKEVTRFDDMDALENKVSQNKLIAGLIGGLNKMQQGVAGMGGAKIGAGQEASQFLNQLANQPIEQYKRKIQNNELMKSLEYKDPTSNQSQFYQGLVQKYFPGIDVGNMTASTLLKSTPLMQSIANMEARKAQTEMSGKKLQLDSDRMKAYLDEKKKTRGRLESSDLQHGAIRAQKAAGIKPDAVVEQIDGFNSAMTMAKNIKNGNSNSIPILGINLAKALGEKGVLTDADVTRYMQQTAWGRQFLDFINKGGIGTLTNETLKQITANIDGIMNISQKALTKKFDRALNAFQTAYPDRDKKELGSVLNHPAYTSSWGFDNVGEFRMVNGNKYKKVDGGWELVK